MRRPASAGGCCSIRRPAFVYRIFVLFAIVFYIASVWFFIGVALAIWGAITMLLWPVVKFAGYLLKLPRAARARQQAISISLAALTLVLAVLLFAPMPLRIQTEGVVWLPEEANVRAGADGFVRSALVEPGTEVAANTPLIESHDPVIAAELAVLEGRVAELEARLEQQLFAERVQAEITRQELNHEYARHARMLERARNLIARSAVQGRFVVERPADLPGRYYRKGELLGYVIQDAPTIVRVVVSQDDVDLVRSRLLADRRAARGARGERVSGHAGARSAGGEGPSAEHCALERGRRPGRRGSARSEERKDARHDVSVRPAIAAGGGEPELRRSASTYGWASSRSLSRSSGIAGSGRRFLAQFHV
jgi:hypothetical protein